jgi:hypothetical protein
MDLEDNGGEFTVFNTGSYYLCIHLSQYEKEGTLNQGNSGHFRKKKPGLWIRIGSGFSDFVDPDPYWESGSRGKKIKKFQCKNALF